MKSYAQELIAKHFPVEEVEEKFPLTEIVLAPIALVGIFALGLAIMIIL